MRGCCLFVRGSKLSDAKHKKIKCPGLRWLGYNISHATANQTKTRGPDGAGIRKQVRLGGVRRGG
jgi:hypothetical protein